MSAEQARQVQEQQTGQGGWSRMTEGRAAEGEGAEKGVFRVGNMRCLVTVPVNMFSPETPRTIPPAAINPSQCLLALLEERFLH